MTVNYYIIPGIVKTRLSTFEEIKNAVSVYTGISHVKIHSKSRKQEIIFARHLIVYFARNKSRMTLAGIGRCFGQDHTTIMKAISKIEGYLHIKDEDTCKAVESIERLIR